MRQPRNQHYVPQMLLKRFTAGGRLWSSDLETGKQWHALPKEVAFERDLYRSGSDRANPNATERSAADMEDEVAKILDKVERDLCLPEGKARETLIRFVAFQAARVPIERKALEWLHSNSTDPRIREVLTDWYVGGNLDADPRLPLTQDDHLRILERRADWLFESLANRRWQLLHSTSGSIICSDRPVTVSYFFKPTHWAIPWFNHRNTEVTLPLSRGLLLTGTFEEIPRRAELVRREVGYYNFVRTANCFRQVYSTQPQFPWWDGVGTVPTGFARLRDRIISLQPDRPQR